MEFTRFRGIVTNDPTYVPIEGFTEVLFPYVVDNDNKNIFIQVNNNIRLSPKKDLFLGINYWFLSPKQIEFGRLTELHSLDVNIKKMWKSWTIMVEVQDILRTNNDKIASKQEDGYYNNVAADEYNRQLNVRLTYNLVTRN